MKNTTDTPEQLEHYTKVVTDIYHQYDADPSIHQFDFIESKQGCNTDIPGSHCVTLNCCFDKKAYEWLKAQGENHHITLNKILTHLMQLQESTQKHKQAAKLDTALKSSINNKNSDCC